MSWRMVAAAVTGAAEHVQQHAVGDLEPEVSRSGGADNQALEGVLVPGHEIPIRRFASDEFLAAAGGFFLELSILDHVFGGLDDDPAAVVESFASGAAADLVEIAGAEDDGFLAVELAEAGEQDGADGDIDADAEGIGAADDLEETALGELFDEHAVFGEQAGVVNADAVFEPGADGGTVRAGEVEAFEGLGEGLFFVPGADIDAGEGLGAFGGVGLGEMDDVNRGFALGASCSRVWASGVSL
jgi:hypothetical protein